MKADIFRDLAALARDVKAEKVVTEHAHELVERWARAECERLGLYPDLWGSQTLDWSKLDPDLKLWYFASRRPKGR